MSDKKTIGILYIATGPYIAFWEDFYKTFESKFLTDFERHYYVFTDATEIYAEGENVNIQDITGKSGIYAPFDRNRKSSAYVPYNCGKTYVIGAMNGGTSKAFLEMSRKLDYAIKEDWKKNVIARWHDESQLNHYIIGRDDVRVLQPQYCYPYGMSVGYEKKISAVSKQAKFDAKTFKGLYEKDNASLMQKI